MKTELGFLLELLFEHKLPKEARNLCKERVAQVEAALVITPQVIPRITRSVQAAQEAVFQTAESIIVAPPTIAQTADRIRGGEKQTGEGTRGPRKF